MKKQIKKLIRAIRLRLAYWHEKRCYKLRAKALGGKKYYLKCKQQLSSLYGMSVTEMENIYEAFNSGETHCDMSSLYPRVMKEAHFSYKDTDSCKGVTNGKA